MSGVVEPVPGSGEPTPPAPAAGSVSVAEALGETPLAGDHARDEARRFRLSTRVATALKAALDWIGTGTKAPRPLRFAVEESVVELGIDQVDPAGLAAAGEVLASVGGNLGPGVRRDGAEGSAGWRLRVPAAVERPFYLMVRQGGLDLALPWHAVLRLRMFPEPAPRAAADAGASGTSPLGAPLLGALVASAPHAATRPLALVAHGLRRAWLPVDEVVWRLSALPCEPGSVAPIEGITSAVRSEDGERFWLVEPAWLLRGVSVPALPQRHPLRDRPSPPPPPERVAAPKFRMLRSEDVEPIPAAAVAPAPVARPEPERSLAPAPAARPESGRSLVPAPAARPEPGPSPAPASELESAAPPAGPASRPDVPRTALVGDDSITAGIFLARLLEQHGFLVQVATSASELRAAISAGPWTLVCADIDLPDERGAGLMRELAERRASGGYALVALVRDPEDAMAASQAGVPVWLRKPFEAEAIGRALQRAGLVEKEAR